MKGKAFYDSIYDVIYEGGDTDTNACIVGGMLGAWAGFLKLSTHEIISDGIAEMLKFQYSDQRMKDKRDFLCPG